MKYNIARKYKLPTQFEMLELGVEGTEDPKKTLDEIDKIAKEYIQKLIDANKPTIERDGKTYIVEPSESRPIKAGDVPKKRYPF